MRIKDKHDCLLKRYLGDPPYKFDWGEITSNYDPGQHQVKLLSDIIKKIIRYRDERREIFFGSVNNFVLLT